MRVMILGAGGMLGHDIVATAPRDSTLFPFTKADLDITDESLLARTVGSLRPDIIMNAAAYTAVDRAEAEPEVAFRVNGEAVGQLGRIAARAGARVVHYSTDYVFDGSASVPYKVDSPTRPINTYGASKLAGEKALSESGARFLILRSQWLFGAHGRCFPKTMHERATRALPTKVVTDQTGRPTYTYDLARVTWKLTNDGATGVLHVANEGQATWFEVAKHIFQRAKRLELLSPCTSADYPTPARRPRYSVLGVDPSRIGNTLRDWRSALDQFLDDLASC
jgi:dTDP-4-dehydrorhamnose reductase